MTKRKQNRRPALKAAERRHAIRGAFIAVAALSALWGFGGLSLAGQQDPAGDIDAVYSALRQAGETSAIMVAQADPAASPPGNLLIEPADEDPIKFDAKLSLPGTPMDGRSIEEMIVGAPIYPPIEGLPPAIWENKPCGTCHQWTKERICVQAKTYIGKEHMVGRLEHPYGLPFKQLLERWAETGCL